MPFATHGILFDCKKLLQTAEGTRDISIHITSVVGQSGYSRDRFLVLQEPTETFHPKGPTTYTQIMNFQQVAWRARLTSIFVVSFLYSCVFFFQSRHPPPSMKIHSVREKDRSKATHGGCVWILEMKTTSTHVFFLSCISNTMTLSQLGEGIFPQITVRNLSYFFFKGVLFADQQTSHCHLRLSHSKFCLGRFVKEELTIETWPFDENRFH